jgi:alcohol dehydrogenase, propanol-preferring
MKAAVVHSFDQRLHVEDVPVPEHGPEQVLVRVEASLRYSKRLSTSNHTI